MKQETNILKCVDDERYKKTLPLLKLLEYDQIPVSRVSVPVPAGLDLTRSQGYGYVIYRISGKTEILKRPDLKTLFFPLSVDSGDDSIASGEVEVAGEVLTPGTFAQFDRTMIINAHLDCLIVYLPEDK